ncbi:MAG: aminotransferase class V-fold PLP-dependent enzyme [Pseudomonadota bacterium]
MPHLSRRALIGASLSVSASATLTGCASQGASIGLQTANRMPDDEPAWAEVAAHYDVKPGITNVENGNWGLMARPVLDAYTTHTERVNRDNSFFARREYGPIWRGIIDEVTERMGAQPGEVALTRGASEALQCMIGGYNRLQPGEAVMFADLDYGSIMGAMRWRAKQSGADVVELAIPEQITHDALVAFYIDALDQHPNTRLLLLTHLSHRTGLVMPVRDIADAAHARGVDVVVDAAHSWGQIDFQVPDLGADFVGFNLHKWVGAPVGVGAMYIKADRLDRIDPNLSAGPWELDRIEGRVHTGTSNMAAFMTVPDAFAWQDQLGAKSKAERLAHLRGVWVSECAEVDGIDVLTPDDPRLHAGITSFRFTGLTSIDENKAIAAYLLDEHSVFTVHRTGVAAGACVRVTPGYYNSAEDMRKAAKAIIAARTHFQA